MRTIKLLFTLSLIAVFTAGCNQFEDVITKKEGRWRVTKSIFTQFEDGTQVEQDTWEAPEILEFKADGTGSYETAGVVDSEVTVTWVYNESEEVMTITEEYSSGGTSVTVTYPWDIVESKKKSQVWQITDEQTSGGVTYRTEVDLELERAD